MLMQSALHVFLAGLIFHLTACSRKDDLVSKFVKTEYFTVEYRNLSAGRINHLANSVDAVYDSISSLLGVEANEGTSGISLAICENQEEYFEEAVKLGASFETAWYSCGITFSGLEAMLVYKQNGKLDDRVIAHEITHCVINSASKNGAIPLWLHEGIALYCEKFSGRKSEYVASLSKIREYQKSIRGGFIPFSELDDKYPHLPEDKLMMYFQSFSFVNYIIGTFGVNDFQKFISYFLYDDLTVQKACRSLFAKSLDELQGDWEKSLNGFY